MFSLPSLGNTGALYSHSHHIVYELTTKLAVAGLVPVTDRYLYDGYKCLYLRLRCFDMFLGERKHRKKTGANLQSFDAVYEVSAPGSQKTLALSCGQYGLELWSCSITSSYMVCVKFPIALDPRGNYDPRLSILKRVLCPTMRSIKTMMLYFKSCSMLFL